MSTVMSIFYDETRKARYTSSKKAQAQVDELIARDLAIKQAKENARQKMIAEGMSESEIQNKMFCNNQSGLFVWLDAGGYRHYWWRKGFYFVRSSLRPISTAYLPPDLVVQKKKLRPDQVEFMERKCRETAELSKQ